LLSNYLIIRQLRNDLVYKNQALARDGPDVGLYDKVVKLGGLPKRLDRLIDESQHLQVRQAHR
jgi:hypothetical protein